MDFISMLGIVAGIITLSGFIPQIYKGWKTKRLDDLSYFMPIIIGIGMFLWIAYGILRNDMVIVLINIIGVLLNTILLLMKFHYSKHHKNR